MYKKKIILIVIGLTLIVAVIASLLILRKEGPNTLDDSGIPCTQEAMICPDGSAVGRSGKDCKFADCPRVQSLDY